MRMFKLRLPALLGAMAAVSAPFAQAELLEYSFTTPDGVERTLSPSSKYANPVGNIKFALSAGIDRKVRVSILSEDGTIVSTATSHLLGAGDKLDLDGKSYYGAVLSVTAPDEGQYTVKSEILTSDGVSVQGELHDYVQDVTKPEYTDFIPTDVAYSAVGTGDLWKLGSGGSSPSNFVLRGVSDTSSIETVEVLLQRTDGTIYTQKEVGFDSQAGEASVSYSSGMFPSTDLDEDFKLWFKVTDKAGNVVTTNKQAVRYDNVVNAPSAPFAVYDPDSTSSLMPGLEGFDAYQAGMVVKTNPIKLAWRIEKKNWYEYREGGLKIVNAFGGSEKVAEDSDYVYVVTTSPYGNVNGNYFRWQNFGQWGGGYISYSLTLSDGAPKSPVLLGVDYNYSDKGWSSFYRYDVKNHELPISITGIRVRVEPRPYIQKASHLGSCEVPVGETSCTIDWDYTLEKGTTGYLHSNASVLNEDSTLRSNPRWAEVNWNDLHYPEITHEYNSLSKGLQVFVTQPGRGNYFDRLRLADSWIEDQDGNRLSITRTDYVNNGANYTYSWDLKTIPEGDFELFAVAQERHGPMTKVPLFPFLSDRTAPVLNIEADSSSGIQSLDDIVITLSDLVDSNPKIKSLNLSGGPANDSVQLSWREESNGRFRLEYPVMFPSLQAGESYTLTAQAVDHQGNTVEDSITFDYKPRQIVLSGGSNGNISLPAVSHEFVHSDGSNIIETEPLTLSDGSLVTGTYDVVATLRSDAELPLVVNGVRIEPGQTLDIMSQHDFSTTEGKLSIPVKPAIGDVVGSSSLLILTTAPNSPMLVVDISTWKAESALTASSWDVRQVIDPVNIQVLPADGVPCRFSTDMEEAKAADAIKDPVCFVEWEQTPDEALPVPEANVAGLSGQALKLGEQPVEYSLYVYSGDGLRVKVGEGNGVLNVSSAMGAVGYRPEADDAVVNRVIEDVDLSFKQDHGPSCALTLNADGAKTAEESRNPTSQNKTCLFEWEIVPEGLSQDDRFDNPVLVGNLAEEGIYPIGWRVSIFSKQGTRVLLAEEGFQLEAVDPENPVVNLTSKHHFKDNMFMVPMTGDYVGDALITAEPADLKVAIERADTQLESEVHSSGVGRKSKVYRRINTDERALWEEVAYKVKASYNAVPEIYTHKEYRMIAIPSTSIKPKIEMANNEAIDTESMSVNVVIRDQFKPAEAFNADKMGSWKVRIVRQLKPGEYEALSDWADVDNGSAAFEVDISEVNATSIRILAEAQLVSPVEGYVRKVYSSSPTFVTVLRGNEIEGNVATRRLSGAAPFIAGFKLNLEERLDYRATGTVIWEVSSDNGDNWEEYTPDERRKYSFVRSFDVGTYQVRAKVVNKNSGAEAYTETLEVISYNKPEIQIKGPNTLLVGSSHTYEAKLTLNDQDIDTSDSVVEWSFDAGKTYDVSGPTITLTRNSPEQIRLWARVRSSLAPEADTYAYDVSKSTVAFRQVKAPRIKIDGPKLVETGKTYDFIASGKLPYKGLDAEIKGFFTLPDGSTVEGNTITYTPTDEDLTRVTLDVSYTAWIDGYKEQGSETTATYKARVWQYVWPEFALSLQTSADVAPVDVNVSVRPVGFRGKLEEPVYTWTLPSNSEVLEQRTDTKRSFKITEAGEHRIVLVVRDARGNERTVEQVLSIGEAEPYAIELKYSGSNKYDREPLSVLVRPYISGGHPRDRIEEHMYSVNGNLLEQTGQYGRAVLSAGDNKIVLKVKSRMGQEIQHELDIPVAENQLPTCEATYRDGSQSWTVYADCKDTDGRVKSYEWMLDGEKLSTSAGRITISKRNHETMPIVELIGIDDAGGRSDSVTLQE